MAPARLAFVSGPDAAPPVRAGVDVVVIDPAWTPDLAARADLVPIRPAVSAVLARSDLLGEALELVDGWAQAAGMVDLLTVDDISYWFRLRETMWNWLHERLLWSRLIAELAGNRPLADVEVLTREEPLIEVARALDVAGAAPVTVRRPPPPPEEPPLAPAAASVGRRAARWLGRVIPGLVADDTKRVGTERARLLDERVAAWTRDSAPRVLAVSLGVRHAVEGTAGRQLVDPHLGAVVARLREEGMRTGVLRLGFDHLRDADWREIEQDADVFPASLLRTRWRSGDRDATVVVPPVVLPDAVQVPLRVDGIDLAAGMLDQVRGFADRAIPTNARLTPRVGAMLADLRPLALLLTHEGHREPWILAARRASIPSFAVQHGIIYATHPGYAHPRHAARMLPTCTFVYGDFERQVLCDHGSYLPEEVEVSGSPRLDLDRMIAPPGGAPGDERAAVRRTLGVADGNRLLVVSTTNGRVARRFGFADILARILGGPLPGVHVVFKQHPGESDEGAYRATLVGLAAAGGYAAPPMTVVRDVDLYRLLRAADAHLGYNSTVISEAVMVGTPNLIAVGQRDSDLLDYVGAGVARPVRTVTELAAALADPRPADPAARRAFLESHFRDGDASARIVARIRASITAAERPTGNRDGRSRPPEHGGSPASVLGTP